MSSITLNMGAVKAKYSIHIEELNSINEVYKTTRRIHIKGKPQKPLNKSINFGKNGIAIQNTNKLLCKIPEHLHIYIPQ